MSAGIRNSIRAAVVTASLVASGISLSATAAAAPQLTVNSAAESHGQPQQPQQPQAAPHGTPGHAGKDTWAWD
ncbi:hypothetical protein [Streptomyces sp. NPDC007369]|uniref:hypothetical protein n=1 Tax=Streptomyces sp. NPDC007369 TaxID=3154589 RepID=UPI003409BCC4